MNYILPSVNVHAFILRKFRHVPTSINSFQSTFLAEHLSPSYLYTFAIGKAFRKFHAGEI